MHSSIVSARVASLITLSHYNLLKKMELMGSTDTEEFYSLVEKLSEHVKVENEIYEKIPNQVIDSFFDSIGKDEAVDKIDARSYLKLKERKKELAGGLMVEGHTLLSSIISSKIYIDVLKDVEKKINSLTEGVGLDYGDIEILKNYHINYKYHYMSANKFLERIALNSYFDVASIPAFSFEEIEEAYNIKFVDSIQNILYDYIVSAIEELTNYETDDKYLLSYISIFEVARVKVMLPYLAEDKLDKIMELYKNNKYSYDKNGALRKVKKLIKKRKEEFNS